MLTQLEIGKIYHVKEFNVLLCEHNKYRRAENKVVPKVKFMTLSKRKVTVIGHVSPRHVSLTYVSTPHGYKIKEHPNYIIYPHEVKEFDTELISVF